MTDAEHRSAEQLTAETMRVNHSADIADGEVVEDMVLPGLHVDFDLRKARDKRMSQPVVRIVIARDPHEPLTSEPGGRSLGEPVDVFRHLMAVVDATELDRLLSGLGQRHAPAVTGDALVRHLVVFRLPSEGPGRNALQLLDRVAAGSVRRSRHRMNRLTPARNAGPREVLGRVPPRDVGLVPWDVEQFSGHTVAIEHGLGAEIADTGLDVQPAVWLDHAQAVEASRAGDVAAHGDADAADFRTHTLPAPRFARFPVERLGAAVERLLDEGTGDERLLPARIRCSELGFAFRRIQLTNLDLIDPELARRFREDRFHHSDPLQTTGLALWASWRRIGDDGDATEAHRGRLIQQ